MNLKKITAIAFAAIGLLAIILGISAFGMDTGYYESNESYGGDAYTGIQNAAAQAANNTMYLAEGVAFASGSILLVAGLTLAVIGVTQFMEIAKEEGMKLPAFRPAAPAPMGGYAPQAPQAPMQPPVQPPVQPQNVFCPNCGTSQAPGSGFCGSCGAKLP